MSGTNLSSAAESLDNLALKQVNYCLVNNLLLWSKTDVNHIDLFVSFRTKLSESNCKGKLKICETSRLTSRPTLCLCWCVNTKQNTLFKILNPTNCDIIIRKKWILISKFISQYPSLHQFGLLWPSSFSSLQLELNATIKNLSAVASQINVSKH